MATRISLTPIGSVAGLDNGPEPLTIEDEVQTWRDTDSAKQEIAHRRIQSMSMNPRAA